MAGRDGTDKAGKGRKERKGREGGVGQGRASLVTKGRDGSE